MTAALGDPFGFDIVADLLAPPFEESAVTDRAAERRRAVKPAAALFG
jgi:hypothetical protein